MMILTSSNDDKKRKALGNLSRAVEVGQHLPGQVFSPVWRYFRLFPSDRLFVEDFVGILRELLIAEGGTVGCLLNLNASGSLDIEQAAALFLDAATTGPEYVAQLRGEHPGVGWLYAMDRYACASDAGEWCIYCEKENDIAVIAFPHREALDKLSQPTTRLCARSIDEINETTACPFPFNHLTLAWREALTACYQDSARGSVE
jgi:hypothetical protein